MFCVKPSINNHIVGLVHKKHTRYYTNVYDVPRSLQMLSFSTIQTVVLTADVFQLFVRLVHKNHTIRTCLMYHAACKIEFQPFKQAVLTADVFQYTGI